MAAATTSPTENTSLFEFSLCLTRACHGKKIIVVRNGANIAFPYREASLSSRCECLQRTDGLELHEAITVIKHTACQALPRTHVNQL